MAVPTLDPGTALIVIDLQQGIVSLPTPQSIAPVIANSVALLAAFRRHELPVVLVNATGVAPGRNEMPPRGAFPAGFSDLIPELDRQPSDHLVTKQRWGAFTGTDLEAWLKSEGVTQIVLCGVATSAGVESTARFAHELGFNVTFAIDAMTDLSIEAHDNSLSRIFPKIGETGSSAEIIALLDVGR